MAGTGHSSVLRIPRKPRMPPPPPVLAPDLCACVLSQPGPSAGPLHMLCPSPGSLILSSLLPGHLPQPPTYFLPLPLPSPTPHPVLFSPCLMGSCPSLFVACPSPITGYKRQEGRRGTWSACAPHGTQHPTALLRADSTLWKYQLIKRMSRGAFRDSPLLPAITPGRVCHLTVQT